MKNIWIIISLILFMTIFIYFLNSLSNDNICTWVRIFDCQNEEKQNLVKQDKYIELKPTWDIFLKYCYPIIKEEQEIYSVDYSKCDLKVNILKNKPWIDSVFVNWKNLTRDEINNSFK